MNIEKSIAQGVMFYGKPCKKGHNGLRYIKNDKGCVFCQMERSKKYKYTRDNYLLRNKNDPLFKAKQRKHQKNWRINNPKTYLIRLAKIRAKENNIDFAITEEDIKIPEICPVFGYGIKHNSGSKQDNSISLDRIDNSKGYTKDNIAVISWKANRLKNNATIEDLRKLLKYMESVKNG